MSRLLIRFFKGISADDRTRLVAEAKLEQTRRQQGDHLVVEASSSHSPTGVQTWDVQARLVGAGAGAFKPQLANV